MIFIDYLVPTRQRPVPATLPRHSHAGAWEQDNEQEFRQLLFNAVKIGRMRILTEEHEIWVQEILGADLIQQCHSLKKQK